MEEIMVNGTGYLPKSRPSFMFMKSSPGMCVLEEIVVILREEPGAEREMSTLGKRELSIPRLGLPNIWHNP